MPLTDPIADMLTRIRNALQARRDMVPIPGSKLNQAVLQQMLEEGYLADVTWQEDDRQGVILVRLKYDDRGDPAIDGLQRLSKPGRRVYVGVGDIPQARSGYGTVILSTSRGVLTDKKARQQGLGGEVLCSIW